jgi:hypothetical protein
MGDAKKRGPYERRKDEAMAKAEAARSSFPAIKVGDYVQTSDGKRLLVTELTPTGFKGNVIPPEKP